MKLVQEFDFIHFRLLEESKGDIRTVRNTIRAIDGKPKAGIQLEGRNAHPVKPTMKAWKELYDNGLVSVSDPEIVMSEKAYELGSLTPLGLRFLEFVEQRKEVSQTTL